MRSCPVALLVGGNQNVVPMPRRISHRNLNRRKTMTSRWTLEKLNLLPSPPPKAPKRSLRSNQRPLKTPTSQFPPIQPQRPTRTRTQTQKGRWMRMARPMPRVKLTPKEKMMANLPMLSMALSAWGVSPPQYVGLGLMIRYSRC
jgi:hypothetical protein